MTKQQWIEKWGYIIPFEALQFLEAMAEDAFPEHPAESDTQEVNLK